MVGVAFIVVFFVVVLIWQFWLQSRTKCPDCGSYKVMMINQAVDKVTQLDQFHDEGAGTRLRMEITETFRCAKCETVWKRERKET